MLHLRKPIMRMICAVFSFVFLLAALGQPVSSISYSVSPSYASSIFYHRLADIELTGDGRVDLVNVALSQYGYKESSAGNDLRGMQDGYSNYTEYGYWYGMQSLWCAMFVSWCADNAGISENVIPTHAYTPYGVIWFIDRNLAYTRSDVEEGKYTPLAGDLIYFRSPRNDNIVNHVGIVIGYFDGYIYTIEGNTNFNPNFSDGGQVLIRSRHISDPVIRYICSPNYDSGLVHEIGSFFPSGTASAPQEEPKIPTPTPDSNAVEIVHSVHSGTTSEMPQYNFIP